MRRFSSTGIIQLQLG